MVQKESAAGIMLELKSVSKTYRSLADTMLIADRADLSLKEGQVIGLVGPSGSGKSTFGRMLLGLEKPDRGRLSFDGSDVWKMGRTARQQYRRSVQFVPQHPDAAFNPRRTIGASLIEVFRFHRVCATEEQTEYLGAALDHVRVHPELLSRRPGQLSGGELQRLAIARAILAKPRFLILDEVTSMLDVSVQASIIRMLQNLQHHHRMGYLCITHNLELASVFCTDIFRLNHGKLYPSARSEENF